MDPSPRHSLPTGTAAGSEASLGGEGEDGTTTTAGREFWRLVSIRVAIAAYWLTMFLATHLPVQRVMEQLPASDKHLHFGAYAVLGFALPWWPRRGRQRSQSWWYASRLFVLLLAYAAIDELLQIPVGRSAEWGDWLADAVGAAIGIAAGHTLQRRRLSSAR